MEDAVLVTGNALLAMLPTAAGGITYPWRTGVRPNHRRAGDDFCFIGELRFVDRETLGPGKTCEAAFRVIVLPEMSTLFVPGFRWELTVAGKVVGHATVLGAVTGPG